jgi:hypothetical protein
MFLAALGLLIVLWSPGVVVALVAVAVLVDTWKILLLW